MKSAKRALKEAAAFKKHGRAGSTYVGVGLSCEGYHALQIDPAEIPGDAAFRRGMRDAATRRALIDPPASEWDAHYQGAIHAIVLIGDKTPGPVRDRRRELLGLLPASAQVLGEERGRPVVEGRGIEHFGYVDGRSQPLFLTEDVDQTSGPTKDGDRRCGTGASPLGQDPRRRTRPRLGPSRGSAATWSSASSSRTCELFKSPGGSAWRDAARPRGRRARAAPARCSSAASRTARRSRCRAATKAETVR